MDELKFTSVADSSQMEHAKKSQELQSGVSPGLPFLLQPAVSWAWEPPGPQQVLPRHKPGARGQGLPRRRGGGVLCPRPHPDPQPQILGAGTAAVSREPGPERGPQHSGGACLQRGHGQGMAWPPGLPVSTHWASRCPVPAGWVDPRDPLPWMPGRGWAQHWGRDLREHSGGHHPH